MSDNIIQLNEDLIKHDLKDLVRSSVEETLNALLDKEVDEPVNAQKYARSADRQGYRSGQNPSTISNLNKKAYEYIETWRTHPLAGSYPYVYVDGVYLKRSWGGEIQNISILVAIAVSRDSCREIIGAAEGMKEDKASWCSFFVWLKERGLTGVRLIIGDKNLGMFETIPEIFPDACYQRCTIHFYRNIFSVTPRNKMKAVAMMLKAIHAQEGKEAAREKARQVAGKRKEMKLVSASKKVQDGIEETLTYMDFPTQHWTRIQTNNTIER